MIHLKIVLDRSMSLRREIEAIISPVAEQLREEERRAIQRDLKQYKKNKDKVQVRISKAGGYDYADVELQNRADDLDEIIVKLEERLRKLDEEDNPASSER